MKNFLFSLSLLCNMYFFLWSSWIQSSWIQKMTEPSRLASGVVIKTKMPATASNGIIINNGDDNPTSATPLIYGHVHMAKSAGTDINGKLAQSYERVCGHKGYSYDYYQVNERAAVFAAKTNGTVFNGTIYAKSFKDTMTKVVKEHSRWRVPDSVMDEIGYENCDYVSVERGWQFWKRFVSWSHLELHVPCRDPMDHLMSQCNSRRRTFNCDNPDVDEEIQKCTIGQSRFSSALVKQPNITVKCFNPIPVDNYLGYMGKILQKKNRRQRTFIHRDNNRKRNKNDECLWKSPPEFQKKVHDLLLARYDFYPFCQQCMGSENELVL